MATILDRYGIKEVADVTFYKIAKTDDIAKGIKKGDPTVPVLYLDTLKVSTIEQTAENTSARGGKGNPELIIWDYGKEITVTLEDALFSAKSMAMMFGDESNINESMDVSTIYKIVTKDKVYTKTGDDDSKTYWTKIKGTEYECNIPSGTSVTSAWIESVEFYKAGTEDPVTDATWDSAADGKEWDYAKVTTKLASDAGKTQITIGADTFPGTYYVTGDTYARSEADGTDEFFQFIIPKAKVQSEVTLTMEAEGDPSTFNMNLKVLRPADGEMLKLVKYDLKNA